MPRVLRSQTYSSLLKISDADSPTPSKVTKPKSDSAEIEADSIGSKTHAANLKAHVDDEEASATGSPLGSESASGTSSDLDSYAEDAGASDDSTSGEDSKPMTNSRAMRRANDRIKSLDSLGLAQDRTLMPHSSLHSEPIHVVLSFKEVFDFMHYKTMAWFEYNWGTYNDAPGNGLYHLVRPILFIDGAIFETRDLMTGRRAAVGNEAMKEILTWSREERARRKWAQVTFSDMKIPFYDDIKFAVLIPETMSDVVGEVWRNKDINTPW